MKKRKGHIDRKLETLKKFIEGLLKKHPPIKDKDITLAYQAYHGEFSERRKQKIIAFSQWQKIYIAKKKAETIAHEIINASKLRVINNVSGNMGKGGHRGLSKQCRLYINAERILFNPEIICKKFKLNITPPYELLFLIKRYGKGQLPANYDTMTRKALAYCIFILGNVMMNFLSAYDPKNSKYQVAVSLLFGKDHPLAKEGSSEGKNLTHSSLIKRVKDFSAHINSGKTKNKKDSRLYTDKKFYYLAWLASMSNFYLDFDNDLLKESVIKEIENILKKYKLFYSEQIKVLNELIDRKKSDQELLARLVNSPQ